MPYPTNPLIKERAYFSVPNVNNNIILVPDLGGWTFPDDGITVITRIRVPVWGSGNADILVSQRTDQTGMPWWDLRIANVGHLQFFSNNGVDANVSTTIVNVATMSTLPTNEWVWLAAVYRPNNGTGRAARGYTRVDENSPWVEIGSAGGSSHSIPVVSTPLSIGAHSTGNNAFQGDISYMALYTNPGGNQPGGTLMFEFDGTETFTPDATWFPAKSGHPITITRTTGPNPVLLTPRVDRTRVQPIPGWAEFSGDNGNYINASPGAVPADTDVEFRCDFTIPHQLRPGVSSGRVVSGNYIAEVTVNGYYRHAIRTSDTIWNYVQTTIASITGWPAKGTRIQSRAVWDADTATFSQYWRLAEYDLLDDDAPWNFVGSVVLAGKTVTATGNFQVGGQTNLTFRGSIFRALILHNGSVFYDIDFSTDVTDAAATTITTRSGHTVSVARDSSGIILRPTQYNAYWIDDDGISRAVLDAYFNGARADELEIPVST